VTQQPKHDPSQASANGRGLGQRPRAVYGTRIVAADGVLEDKAILIGEGTVQGFAPAKPRAIPDALTIHVDGGWVVPGFIDIHTHGGAGADMMDSSAEALQALSAHLARHGVTAFYPTTMAAPADEIGRIITAFTESAASVRGAAPLGIHLEGPYLSADYRGTQPSHLLHAADPFEYEPWLGSGVVRLITLAPEIPGCPALIARACQSDIRVAIGHTMVSYEQAVEAFDLGATQATHLFNGMAPLHHRTPGPIGAVLSDDRVFAQLIPDGFHVHPAVMKLVIRAKGVQRTVLVSDANRGAGMPDGTYFLGQVRIHTKDGVARNDQGGLAGSIIALDRGLRIAMQAAGLSLPDALPMVTSSPAAAMGIAARKGRLAPGSDADLVVLDDELNVKMTIVGGRVVFTDGTLG
jgi:N-acetylglucosamine-6-phosphate deacetylase